MARKRIRSQNLIRVKLRVKEVAESKGFTQTKLSRQAELQYPTVHGLWVNPYRDASIYTLAKVARALDVPIESLYIVENNEQK